MSPTVDTVRSARGVPQVGLIDAEAGSPGDGVRRSLWRASPPAGSDRTRRTISSMFRQNIDSVDQTWCVVLRAAPRRARGWQPVYPNYDASSRVRCSTEISPHPSTRDPELMMQATTPRALRSRREWTERDDPTPPPTHAWVKVLPAVFVAPTCERSMANSPTRSRRSLPGTRSSTGSTHSLLASRACLSASGSASRGSATPTAFVPSAGRVGKTCAIRRGSLASRSTERL